MRIAAATLVGLVALAALGASSAPSRSVLGSARTPRSVLDVGDSLSVGAGPYLRARLHGYRITPWRDVGMHAYDAASIVDSRRSSLPPALVVSAGTNDDPRIVSTFWRVVSAIVAAAGPSRCVVWPTIVRPPAVGATYDGFNRALEHVAAHHRNLVLVDWVGMVRSHPWWLSRDGVHVSAAGYRARASAIAEALATRCST